MTVLSKDGHDISGTTANRPTNAEPGMLYYDTTLDCLCVVNAAGVMVPVAGLEGVKAVTAAGTNQATAAALTAGVQNLVTAADGAKGVVLPASADTVNVFNSSASPLYVYPLGTNTINGGAASAPVLMKANSSATFYSESSTTWAAQLSNQNSSVSIGASTAAAGTTTSDAGVLPAGTAEVYLTTGATDTAGVRINAADNVANRRIFVANGVSNKILKIYAPSGGTINGGSADAAFSTASGKGAILVCTAAGTWYAW